MASAGLACLWPQKMECESRCKELLAGWPCVLRQSPDKGRYLVAARPLSAGEAVLRTDAYLSAVLPSWRKRVCARCAAVPSARLRVACARCGQAWYCGPACRAEHWAAGAAGAARPVPHAAVCAVLARFGSLKCDADMKSVLRMCLDALALLRQETEAPVDASSVPRRLPAASPPAPCSATGDGTACVPRARAYAVDSRVPDPVQGISSSRQAELLEVVEASGALVSAPAPGPCAPACAPCSATGSATGGAPCTGDDVAASRGHDPIQGWEPSAQAASPAANPDHGPEPSSGPALSHADLLRLQDHSADLLPRDHADWLKALRFLSHALAAEGWPHLPVLGSGLRSEPGSDALCRGGMPASEPASRAELAGCGVCGPDSIAASASIDPQALLGLVGRICTNNFGVFRACGEGRPGAPSAGPEPSRGAQPGLGTSEPGLREPALGLPMQPSGRSRGSVLGEAGAWPLAAPERAAHWSGACTALNDCMSNAAECSPADAPRSSAGPCGSPRSGSVAEQPDCAASAANSAGPCDSPEGSSMAEQPGDAAPAAFASGLQTIAGVPEAPRTPAQCGAATPGRGGCRSGTAREAGDAQPEAPAAPGRARLAMPGHEDARSVEACPGIATASGSKHEACSAGAAAAPNGAALGALDCPLRKGAPDPVVHPGPPLAGGALLPNSGGGLPEPAASLLGPPHAQEVLVGRELYIMGSFINHACAPNCVLVLGRGWAIVTALRPLAEGEPLSINYIDAMLPRAARRDVLRANFFFDCDCLRCEHELAEGSAKCSYARSQAAQRADCRPKRRGRKARVAR